MVKFKYTPEITQEMVNKFNNGLTAQDLALEYDIPIRSVIAKLSLLGVYKRKEYTNKRGEKPIKKEEYVERIAKLLHRDVCVLESLEKVNKNVLRILEEALTGIDAV